MIELSKEIKKIDIYYYIDLNKEYDIEYIKKCLEIHFKTNNMYLLNKFEEIKISNKMNDSDTIKKGIDIFKKTFNNLKLKMPCYKHDVWFIYISNGDIREIYKNIFVILLDKNQNKRDARECYYIINKETIDIKKEYSKNKKIQNIKNFNVTFRKLLTTKDIISY